MFAIFYVGCLLVNIKIGFRAMNANLALEITALPNYFV